MEVEKKVDDVVLLVICDAVVVLVVHNGPQGAPYGQQLFCVISVNNATYLHATSSKKLTHSDTTSIFPINADYSIPFYSPPPSLSPQHPVPLHRNNNVGCTNVDTEKAET